MSAEVPFDGADLGEARERYRAAIVELHDGVLVITPPPDAAARAAVAVLVASLLPHIEAGGLWIEGSANVEFDDANVRNFAIALWAIDAHRLPALVIHVMSGTERVRGARARIDCALELGIRYALLVDPKSRSLLAFTGVERTEAANGRPFSELLPRWSPDEVTLA